MQWKPHNCILYEDTLELVILTQSAKYWSKVLHLPKSHCQLMAQILSSLWLEMFSWCVNNSNAAYNSMTKTVQLFHDMLRKGMNQQVCIPVGCVPAAHWLSASQGCLVLGGVWSGGCVWSWGCLVGGCGPVGCLLLGGVVCGDVWSWGVWYPSMHWGRHPPRQNHRCL